MNKPKTPKRHIRLSKSKGKAAMSENKLQAIAPFFSSLLNVVQTVGIIIALAFTAYEMKKTTSALEQTEYGSVVVQQQEIFNIQLQNSDVYLKSLYCSEKLSPSEIWKVTEILYMRIELAERLYEANKNGIITKSSIVSSEIEDAQIYLNTPLGKLIWKRAKGEYEKNPDFVSKIDEALKSNTVEPDDQYFRSLSEEVSGSKFNPQTICDMRSDTGS